MINLNLPPRVAAAMRELRSEPGALRFEGIRSVEGALAIGGPIHLTASIGGVCKQFVNF